MKNDQRHQWGIKLLAKFVYIHVPFCRNICSYCDFPKVKCHNQWINQYLVALKSEIKTRYQKELVETIYFGGGTPSALSVEQLNELLSLIKLFKTTPDVEITIEANVADLTKDKIALLTKHRVNRVSIGVQTLDPQLLKLLNRQHTYEELTTAVTLLNEVGLSNYSFDLMYALPGQTIASLKNDLVKLVSLKPAHISAYSLIIEPHTKLYLNHQHPIDEDLDRGMYDFIRIYLKGRGFSQYEISNYCKEGYQSQHNINYWQNGNYYGFGLGATSKLNHALITNTKSINYYLAREYNQQIEPLSESAEMELTLILGLRMRQGVNDNHFYQQFKQHIANLFDISDLIFHNGYYSLAEQDVYVSNQILMKFINRESDENEK